MRVLPMKRILIFGLGKTNTPLYEYLVQDPSNEVYVSSDSLGELKDYSEDRILDPSALQAGFFDEIYCVPGVSSKHPLFSLGKVKNEIEFSIQFFDSKVIGVTGTNGKSTLSKFLHDFLTKLGYQCILAGNYGSALASFLGKEMKPDVIILELSSFQLYSLHKAFLDFAVLASFEPDHLDWHGGLKEYRDAKAKIFTLLKPGGLSLAPIDWKEPKPSRTFAVENELADYVLGDTEIRWAKGSIQLPSVDRSLMLTYLMACSVLIEMGVDIAQLDAFDFQGLGHRLEKVREIDGTLFINDSKSTTPGSTLFALDRIERSRILLILGGKEKGIELATFFQGLVARRERIVKIFTYGEFGVQTEELRKLGFDVESSIDYEELIKKVLLQKNMGDCVLLSPGFSSLDQLASFEERGEKFKKFVQCL